jgi:hypothetical protein
MPKKKGWIKPKQVIVNVGICRYCKKLMTNEESFVSFYGGGHAHWLCMKEDTDKNESVLRV